MDQAIELLNLLLSQSHPHETIRLPLQQAMIVSKLPERELGSLFQVIKARGAVRALEEEGLFSRRIIVVYGDGARFSVDRRSTLDSRDEFAEAVSGSAHH